MSSKEATASYVEQASQSYSLIVDAYASANQRALEYAKSVWEITSRPYATNALETAVQDGFERANQIVSLSIAELQAAGQRQAELAEKLVTHAAKLQESYTGAMKGVVDTGISNMNYVKDTATAQFEDFAKRVEDVKKTAVSAN